MQLETTLKSELADRVRQSMRRLGGHRLQDVYCIARGTTIVLRGNASSFYRKQLAQVIAAKVPGVHYVINEVRVEPPCEL